MNNIPLYGYAIFCLSIHQLMGMWVVSIFLVIMNNTAISICVQVLSDIRFLLDIYLVELLDHLATLSLTF